MLQDIDIQLLRRADANVREENSDDEHLELLSKDIDIHGLLHSPVVVPNDENGFDVISGWRRVQACRLLKWNVVPCSVREDIKDTFLVSFAENMQRHPMTRKEIIRAISRYMETNTAKDVAKMMSLTPATVSRYNSLATLDDETLSRLDAKDDSRLTLNEAEKLVKGPDPAPGSTDDDNNDVTDATVVGGNDDGEPPEKKAKTERKKPVKSEPWIYNHEKKPVPIPQSLYPKILKMVEPYLRT